MSTFSIVDVNGAENNYANTVTSVGETCESTSGTTNQWQGVTLLGTSSKLLVNKGSGHGNSFDTTITVPHVGKFTSTNILRFGFSQHGQSDEAEDVEVTDASFTFNVQNTFSLTDILSIATSSNTTTHCGSCDLDLDDINDVGYEFIGKGTWCSSAKRENSLSHVFSRLSIVSTSIICITHLYQKKITRTRNAQVRAGRIIMYIHQHTKHRMLLLLLLKLVMNVVSRSTVLETARVSIRGQVVLSTPLQEISRRIRLQRQETAM